MLQMEHCLSFPPIMNIGGLLREQGRYTEAEEYYREALAIYPHVLSDDHPHSLWATMNMGGLLREQGKYLEAETYVRKALEGRRRSLGDAHPETLGSFKSMIKLYDEWETPEKAAEYRAMLETIEAKKAETTEPAAP